MKINRSRRTVAAVEGVPLREKDRMNLHLKGAIWFIEKGRIQKFDFSQIVLIDSNTI